MNQNDETKYGNWEKSVCNPDAGSLAPGSGSVIPADHPEAKCDDCRGANVVWFAPSPIWNKVARTPYECDPMLCPRCFIVRAEAMGLRFVWEVYPEVQPESGDIGRAIANALFDMANNKRIGLNDWVVIRDAALQWERHTQSQNEKLTDK